MQAEKSALPVKTHEFASVAQRHCDWGSIAVQVLPDCDVIEPQLVCKYCPIAMRLGNTCTVDALLPPAHSSQIV